MCEMMKCQLLCSDEFTELAKAMIKVQQAIRPANKDSYNVSVNLGRLFVNLF